MAIEAKTETELEMMRQSALLVSKVMGMIAKELKIGKTGLQLDKLAYEMIKDNGASPSFLNYNGYPYTLCISVNDAVVHGFPSDKPFKSTDIVSVDCGVYLNGFHGDMAYTFAFGEVSEDIQQLMKVTKQSLYLGIEKAVTNNRVGDISYAIQYYCEKQHPYSCVKELVGHGVGKKLHEEPQVPNIGKRGEGKKLITNLTIAIEPMVNMGSRDVKTLDDDWTVVTIDGKPSAHFEHTVCVKPQKAEILTTFNYIESEIKTNSELLPI
ncbi:MAG: type I methionyl aminopeptidase [Chitinophagales bacterium]|nr:type I methionyl aminopeptidase [Chitinophagales bacterium]MDW8273027.1 type I methionyl aminopeptidase [Chitinophagales bacterium]